LEQSLVQQLQLEVHGHHPTTGTYREEVWKSLFEQIIPKKFCIKQGVFIIDSEGYISREVDLAIFDEQYTPYIFNYGKIKFIPIEAVAVVVQCKSNRLNIGKLKEWDDSIEKLRTSLNSVVRIAGRDLVDSSCLDPDPNRKNSQTATRPIKILCSTMTGLIASKYNGLFDIILHISKNRQGLSVVIPAEEREYDEWYRDLNHNKQGHKIKKNPIQRKLTELRIAEENNVLLTLIFQLNQLLMIINNPMFFPHQSYVNMFRKYSKGSEL
jgi:hypothetical protein